MKFYVSCCSALGVLTASGVLYAQDPTAMGPFTVLTAEYDRGDEAFSCPSTDGCVVPSAEIRAEVYYPSDLGAGPFPLLVFLHGRHRACYDRVTGDSISLNAFVWPCSEGGAGFEPIPSYRGYDYLGRVLASHGYIVASISANGINAQDASTSNQGIVDRAHLVDAHLNIWSEFNTVGSTVDPAPFASGFIGAVDLQAVGTMGHSRGGDGVANHFTLFPASPNYTVRAVLPVAPTNFLGAVPASVELGVLLGYCDGDVYTLEGSRFYDQARYAVAGDESNKFTFLSPGSNHNFFNTVWTPECWTPGTCWPDDRGVMPPGATSDDASDGLFSGDPFCGSDTTGGRLTGAEQRGVGLAYMASFFRFAIGDDTEFLPILRGDESAPAPVDPNVFVGYHAPESRRLDLNRLNDAAEFSETTLTGDGGVHGAVIAAGITPERCGFDQANPCFSGAFREVHLTNFNFLDPGLSRARTAWDQPTDSFTNELPPGARDVSAFDVLQFRVGVDHLDPTSDPVEFSVILEDGAGSAAVNTSLQLGQNDLYFPQSTAAPSPVMNTLRLPLSLFTGVDLGDVERVTLLYNGTPTGTVLLSDIAFVDDEEAFEAPGCQSSESFLVGDRASVTNPDGGPAVHNSGSGLTRVGHTASTGGILSVGAVEVLSNADVVGDIVSEGDIDVDPTTDVTGSETPFGTVDLPPLPTLPAFPAPTGTTIFVNPGSPVSLTPGSRTRVFVNSGGTLLLGAGDYFFQDLYLNSGSTVRVSPSTRVFVSRELAFRTSFLVASGSSVQPITLGFAGATAVLEARFDGTLIAPNARVSFGVGSGLTYTGSFFGRILEVRPDSSLVCLTPNEVPPAPTCSDGTQNGSETGVDCGGPTCAACAPGNPCNTGSDCQTGICTGGICQPPAGSVTATRSVTSNWPGGYCVTLNVTNSASLPTTNWSVSLNTNASTIYTSWNGTFSGNSGAITVQPAFPWNRVISAGATNSSVGFCANRAVVGSGTLPIILSAAGTF